MTTNLYKFFNSAKELAEYLVSEDYRTWYTLFDWDFHWKYYIKEKWFDKPDYLDTLIKDIEDRVKVFPVGYRCVETSYDYNPTVIPYRDAINENIKELTKENEKYLNRVKENLKKIDELLKMFVE